jgi:hypothetical protein
MLKAIRALSEHLGVPVSIDDRKKKHTHGPEPFIFRAQEELNYKWYNKFSEILKETYGFIIKYMGLPEITILSKANPGEPLTHRGKIIYSPETGEPIKRADWEAFVKDLENFLNRKLKGTDKRIILEGKALGRILNRMLKYNRYDNVTRLPLGDVKYRGKTLDWISENVKNMRTVMGGDLSRPEMARIQVMEMSAGQKITAVSDKVKADVKQTLINGVLSRRSTSQISQDLFDKMSGHNRDFQMIADTEIQNAVNNATLLDEVHNAEPGEKIYFQRVEVVDQNTCNFCRKMNGVVVLWSDTPLEDDRIKDPVADFAIWDGKDWNGKKEFVANGVFHPYCRGRWMRYDKTVDALVAHLQNKSELYNKALDQARAEWKEKGIENPNDKTPGFLKRINELYAVEEGTIEKAVRIDEESISDQGIKRIVQNRGGFIKDRVFQALYGDDTIKSLTWSGYKLQDKYRFAGFDISIENKAGTVRSGKDKDGHDWHCKIYHDYGYIRGSIGVDGDHVDVYIGPDEEALYVYVVHQNDPVTGKYDEDKVMLGFTSMKDARQAYLKQYDRPGFLGSIDTMALEEFREKVLAEKNHGKIIKSYSERVQEALGRGL